MNGHPTDGLVKAEAWSLFAGALGQNSIYFGIVAFAPPTPKNQLIAKVTFALGCLGIFIAFGVLTALFVKDQFQFEYVFAHGDTLTELKYKEAGVWTAQQGSFLLWALTSAIFGVLSMNKAGPYTSRYLGAFGLFLAALCGILAYETPFHLLKDVTMNGVVFIPPRGSGMTPALQNYWVVIHPPTIFTGFGSLAVPFAFGLAAMFSKNATDWTKLARPWILTGIAILGLGISMGGLWAYETQGWGGFWAWDPVENVSFVPWLFMAVLAHGIIVQIAKGIWAGINLLLAGVPFITFVYGTFLTRSGLLDGVSNHSFASMDKGALVVLKFFLIGLTAIYIGVWIFRGRFLVKQSAGQMATSASGLGISRTDLYRNGLILLSLVSTIIALGMSWPVISAMFRSGNQSKIDEALYHQVVVWFFIPIMLAMAVTPFVGWRKEGFKVIGTRLITITSISLMIIGAGLLVAKDPTFGVGMLPNATIHGPFGTEIRQDLGIGGLLLVCVFCAVANMWRAVELGRKSPQGLGGFIAHLGLAVLFAGLILSRGFEKEAKIFVRDGAPDVALDYRVSYLKMDGKNLTDRDNKVVFEVQKIDKDGRGIGKSFNVSPGLYYYDQGETQKAQVWPAIRGSLSHDMYFAMQEPEINAWAAPLDIKPGESKQTDSFNVQYLKPTMEGSPGTPGAKFGAVVRISYTEKDPQTNRDVFRTYDVNPTMQITDQGPIPSVPAVGQDYRIAMMTMNPATKAVKLQLMFSPPIFPLQVFYKPMTSLVWIGTGIFTLGGLWSAVYRRVKRKAPESDYVPAPEPTPGVEGLGNATGATA